MSFDATPKYYWIQVDGSKLGSKLLIFLFSSLVLLSVVFYRHETVCVGAFGMLKYFISV